MSITINSLNKAAFNIQISPDRRSSTLEPLPPHTFPLTKKLVSVTPNKASAEYFCITRATQITMSINAKLFHIYPNHSY